MADKSNSFPITDDHIHIDKRNGRGLKAAKDFLNSGGTHIFLVSKPSSSFGFSPVDGESYRKIFEETLNIAEEIRETGLIVYPVLGIHPAEISWLSSETSLQRSEEIMKDGLTLAAQFVEDGSAVALKSGRPHYPVTDNIMDASNRILTHAISLATDLGCALQIHAESGPCEDIIDIANNYSMPVKKIVKHYADKNTPLSPSIIAKTDLVREILLSGREFTLESDYMDENSRPGSVVGPKSVPRVTKVMINEGSMTEKTAFRIHSTTPSAIYGVDIEI